MPALVKIFSDVSYSYFAAPNKMLSAAPAPALLNNLLNLAAPAPAPTLARLRLRSPVEYLNLWCNTATNSDISDRIDVSCKNRSLFQIGESSFEYALQTFVLLKHPCHFIRSSHTRNVEMMCTFLL